MILRTAALAAFAVASCLAVPARAQQSPPAVLTLDEAFARVARAHPALRLFGANTDVLLAERDEAALRPPLRLGVEVENVLGRGGARGFDQAEATVALAGVLERGGKLDARRALAQARIDGLSVQREAQRLDLLAETARRYLDVAAAQARGQIARTDIDQRRRAVDAARQRLQAGASPESVLLTAQAALARAELAQARALQQERAALQHLAALWGQRDPGSAIVPMDPLVLPTVAPLETLAGFLERTPELERFVDATRIGEARLQLARSASTPDLDWQLGVRRLQDDGDLGLAGSVWLPLGGAARARPGIRAAEAGLVELQVQREAQSLALYSTLVDAHGRYALDRMEVQRLARDVLPLLGRAERAAERAWRAGATSYLEWSQLQADTIAMQARQLDTALEAHRALIEIQRLTGQGFLAETHLPQGQTP